MIPNLGLIFLAGAGVFVLFFVFIALMLPTITPDYKKEIKKLANDELDTMISNRRIPK